MAFCYSKSHGLLANSVSSSAMARAIKPTAISIKSHSSWLGFRHRDTF